MRKGNQLTNGNVKAAQAVYQEAGLCYTCGMPVDSCLHVDVKRRMGEPEYSEWLGDGRTFDELRAKRDQLATQQAERDKRGRDEAIRVGTGDISRTFTGRLVNATPELGSSEWWKNVKEVPFDD